MNKKIIIVFLLAMFIFEPICWAEKGQVLKATVTKCEQTANCEDGINEYFGSELNVNKNYIFFYNFIYYKDGSVMGDSVSAISKKDYYDRSNNLHKTYSISNMYYSAKMLKDNQAYCTLTNRSNSNRKDSVCLLTEVPVGRNMKQILNLIYSRYPQGCKNDKVFISCKIEDNVNTCKVTLDTFFVNWNRK